MKAIFFEQHGESDVLRYGELARPTPQPGEALIKVLTTSLNHLDIWVRRGWPGLSLKLPHIGGNDIVGEIVEINGSSTLTVAQRVLVDPGVLIAEDEWSARGEASVSPNYKIIGEDLPGGFAEYVAVPLNNLIAAPDSLSDETLAARILTGVTCWRMLMVRGGLKKGETILVVGAGGGVNSLSIQIARAFGATVIALGGSKEKCAFATRLGAHQTLDYREHPQWSKEIYKLTGGSGVDLVVDNVGQATFAQSLRTLKRGGRLLTVGNTSGFNIQIDNRLLFAKQLSIVGSTMGSREDLRNALQFMEQHRIEPAIDCVDTLENGIAQIKRLERGEQLGKIVLRVSKRARI